VAAVGPTLGSTGRLALRPALRVMVLVALGDGGGSAGRVDAAVQLENWAPRRADN
jgi:hypothetical protein